MDRTGIFAGDNPIANARLWLEEAMRTEPNDANAMALATVDSDGMPNVRIVLLKAIEDEGFVFFTNYNSSKGQEIASAATAAVNIHWKSLGRQIRVRGPVEKISPEASDEYYTSRPHGSRIGAWASRQSEVLNSKDDLVNAVKSFQEKYGDAPPRPPHWGGYVIKPTEIEFWADAEFRLHDRFRWLRKNGSDIWEVKRLNP